MGQMFWWFKKKCTVCFANNTSKNPERCKWLFANASFSLNKKKKKKSPQRSSSNKLGELLRITRLHFYLSRNSKSLRKWQVMGILGPAEEMHNERQLKLSSSLSPSHLIAFILCSPPPPTNLLFGLSRWNAMWRRRQIHNLRLSLCKITVDLVSSRDGEWNI